jgi:biopolymer transport protein ExbB
MSLEEVFNWVGFLSYFALAGVFLLGAYFVFLVLQRVASNRFKTEADQDAFLEAIEPALVEGDFDSVQEVVASDSRALAKMANLAIANRHLGLAKVKQLVTDRFSRDVLADIDEKVAWVVTAIKTAPMLGLFGTVMGMMGAFGKLATATSVEPSELAADIRLALETTAIGLAICIPLTMCMAMINNRLRSMQDLVTTGLTRFFEAYKVGLSRDDA